MGAMRRLGTMLVVGGMAFGLSGCLGPLAMMASRGPEAMAKRMGQATGYNAASNVAGSALGQEAATSADTMANIDRILKEHPDAVNADELEELKRNLADELPSPEDEVQRGESLAEDSVEADESVLPPVPPAAAAHDRRSSSFASPKRGAHGVLADDDIGLPEERIRTRNRLRIEQPDTPDQRWRITDQHRFHSPELTAFDEDIPTPAVQSLTGEAYAPRGFERVMLPQGQ